MKPPHNAKRAIYIRSEFRKHYGALISIRGSPNHQKDVHVGYEEDHDDDGVSIANCKTEILLHARNECEAEVGAVNERNGVHDS